MNEKEYEKQIASLKYDLAMMQLKKDKLYSETCILSQEINYLTEKITTLLSQAITQERNAVFNKKREANDNEYNKKYSDLLLTAPPSEDERRTLTKEERRFHNAFAKMKAKMKKR